MTLNTGVCAKIVFGRGSVNWSPLCRGGTSYGAGKAEASPDFNAMDQD